MCAYLSFILILQAILLSWLLTIEKLKCLNYRIKDLKTSLNNFIDLNMISARKKY